MSFEDRLQGHCEFALAERGDVVIRRRDGAFAYQLAVVVDDALQGITDVVRGADLLDSTPWQIALQRSLALPTPRYAHVPLVIEPDGQKLAKSRRSVALRPQQAGAALWRGPQAAAAVTLLQSSSLKAVGSVLAWGEQALAARAPAFDPGGAGEPLRQQFRRVPVAPGAPIVIRYVRRRPGTTEGA